MKQETPNLPEHTVRQIQCLASMHAVDVHGIVKDHQDVGHQSAILKLAVQSIIRDWLQLFSDRERKILKETIQEELLRAQDNDVSQKDITIASEAFYNTLLRLRERTPPDRKEFVFSNGVSHVLTNITCRAGCSGDQYNVFAVVSAIKELLRHNLTRAGIKI